MALRSRDMIDATDPRVSQIGHPAPPWLINYADLMTELVCFFIILYALSASLKPGMDQVPGKVDQAVKDSGYSGDTQVSKEGVRITIKEREEQALFASGRAELNPEALGVLDRLVEVFKSYPDDIVVEGHTDNVPIGRSTFASNWELSTARATTVVRYLIEKHGIPPDRIAAMGYGEHRPEAANDTDASRAKNRRVVFWLKDKSSTSGASSVALTGAASPEAPPAPPAEAH